ncbi:MAG: hypothetical protein QM484_04760 [Woeseiaceae bacterium]
MKKTNRLIVGSALGLAAIAVAIDHTQHRLPDPVPVTQDQYQMGEDEESPCGMGSDSPCSMDDESSSPCSMDLDDSDSSPCGLGD